MMKKTFLWNFLFLIVILVILEVTAYTIESYKYSHLPYSAANKFHFIVYPFKLKTFDEEYAIIKKAEPENSLRQPIGIKYTKRPIILFGCSYTWGSGLKQTQRFQYKLAQFTKRPVYNFAFPAWGVQHMLYILQNEKSLENIKNPEYVIFTFFSDHPYRLNTFSFNTPDNFFYLKYKMDHGRLIQDKPIFPFLYNFYITRYIQRGCWNQKVSNAKNNNEVFELIKKHFIESKKIIDRKYPGTKFVILMYDETNWYIDTPRWQELEKQGFIILHTDKITGKHIAQQEYKLIDGHPNEKAWDFVVPAMAKALKI